VGHAREDTSPARSRFTSLPLGESKLRDRPHEARRARGHL